MSLISLSMVLRDAEFDRERMISAWEALNSWTLPYVRKIEESETWVPKDIDYSNFERMSRQVGRMNRWARGLTQRLVNIYAVLPFSVMTVFVIWLFAAAASNSEGHGRIRDCVSQSVWLR